MKDTGIAYLLWFFAGWFGIHKFYLEKPGIGILYIFTFGLFGIGMIYDLFTLPRQVREANILLTGKQHNLGFPTKSAKNVKPKPLSEKEKEKIVLLTAKKYGGRITPMEIAAESDLSIDEADGILKKISGKGYADIKVSNSGQIFYEFYGFLSDSDKMSGSDII